jgi:hypothetical protein
MAAWYAAPLTFVEGLRQLVEATGLDDDLCRERLKAVLEAGNTVFLPSAAPMFAFRLHQFLASGSSVFATLDAPGKRFLTTEGQYVAPRTDDAQQRRLLFPLAFCHDCGQEYYLVSRVEEGGERYLVPRSPLLNAPDDDTPGTLGFFAPHRDDLWSEDEELPESWYEQRKAGPRIKDAYQPHVPRRYWARSDGSLGEESQDGAVEGWYLPRPLMLCLRCRAAYDLREKSDFRKLATLSQTGRSTATTITTSSAVMEMRHDESVEPEARKVLSFTDNRQDASLQAGHMNDFVQVALLRGALVKAMAREGRLSFDYVGRSVFEALDLQPDQFMA